MDNKSNLSLLNINGPSLSLLTYSSVEFSTFIYIIFSCVYYCFSVRIAVILPPRSLDTLFTCIEKTNKGIFSMSFYHCH